MILLLFAVIPAFADSWKFLYREAGIEVHTDGASVPTYERERQT